MYNIAPFPRWAEPKSPEWLRWWIDIASRINLIPYIVGEKTYSDSRDGETFGTLSGSIAVGDYVLALITLSGTKAQKVWYSLKTTRSVKAGGFLIENVGSISVAYRHVGTSSWTVLKEFQTIIRSVTNQTAEGYSASFDTYTESGDIEVAILLAVSTSWDAVTGNYPLVAQQVSLVVVDL